jgi:hypothetical protein
MSQRQGIHKITQSTDGTTHTISYRFLGQIEGRGYFAQIVLHLDADQPEQQIVFSGQEFAWLKEVYGPDAWEWHECDDFRRAALFGIQYALCNTQYPQQQAKGCITILTIGARLVDTTPETVAYTACLATWKLLNLEGVQVPYIEQQRIHFPGQQPE